MSREGALVRAIGHGRELTTRDVGPRRAEWDLRPATGGPLRDAGTSSLALRIEAGATYDGVGVPGPHLLIEGLSISGPLDVASALPVVVRDCALVAGAGHWGLHVRPGEGAVVIAHCSIEGATTGPAGAGLFLRRPHVTVHRCRIRRFADGIRASADGLVVRECLIDDLTLAAGDHVDGIQIEGAPDNVAILRSRIANQHPQTSALKLQGRRIRVQDCHLSGGGWTLQAGGRYGAREVSVERCMFARDYFPRVGHFGAVADWVRGEGRGFRWFGNRREDGRPLAP